MGYMMLSCDVLRKRTVDIEKCSLLLTEVVLFHPLFVVAMFVCTKLLAFGFGLRWTRKKGREEARVEEMWSRQPSGSSPFSGARRNSFKEGNLAREEVLRKPVRGKVVREAW